MIKALANAVRGVRRASKLPSLLLCSVTVTVGGSTGRIEVVWIAEQKCVDDSASGSPLEPAVKLHK